MFAHPAVGIEAEGGRRESSVYFPEKVTSENGRDRKQRQERPWGVVRW